MLTYSFLFMIFIWNSGSCSVGDRSSDFRSCTSHCYTQNCTSQAEQSEWRLLGWTCLEECRYLCMHRVTAEDVRHSRPVRQFFGKWPFVRVFGVQEPASTFFSALNGITNVIGFMKFNKEAPKAYPYHLILKVQLIINVNTWIWSTIFHFHDLPWTEKLDYFSAASLIITGLIVQFVRISGPSAFKRQVGYTVLWVVLFCCHVIYLSVFNFDYGYNMIASVLAGLSYSIVWVIWCVKNRREQPYVWKCATTVMATSGFALLELLDFAPLWWFIDAHSLWHLSTIPMPLLWYSFLTDDAHYEVKKMSMKQV